jgi:LuxR family maltose regulon positive regulatory protein
VQFADAVTAPDQVVWVSLDADDDDPIGFIASLVEAMEPLDLRWRESPRELVANLAAGGRQGRAAIGALVEALDAAGLGRLTLVLDDLHRLSNPEVHALLETLVERAPDGFTLVASSRTPPPLPVARWRVGGEAAEFGPSELAFAADEVEALAGLAPGERHASLDEVMRRTRGWPAGAALMLRNPGPAPGAASSSTDSRLLLYDYLASEVLQGLPPELQSFAMDVSVLDELTPALCAAVTGHDDARAMLRALYRQDLFVTAIDATVPVLRMHDLFRDFLQARLEATDPRRLPLLHERAAAAEPSLPRAIGHCIAGRHWERALGLMAAHADRLVEEGHRLAMQRWLEQVPEPLVTASEQGLYLRGYGAWLRWDWLQARADMGALLERLRAAGREPPTRLLLFMSGFSSAVGARDEAARLSAEIERRTLAPVEQATHALQLAWRAMDLGELSAVRHHFAAYVELAERDPRTICPLIMDRNTAYVGLPGMLALYDRYLAAARGLVGPTPVPWHATVWILEAWMALWRGYREAAARAIESARELQQHFGGLTPTDDALARLEAVFHASVGEGERALRIARPLVERFESPWAAGIKVVFERAYWAGVGKVAWMAGDVATLREVAARLAEPRRPQEWRFIDLVRITLPGQLAILERRWSDAEAHLAAAIELHAALRFPQGHPDPRVCAAYVQARLGRVDKARAALEPVLQECVAEHSVGPLVCEPRAMVREVIACLTEPRRRDPVLGGLLGRVEAWQQAAAAPRPPPGPLARLTEREREVLARVALGDGNKEIARTLDLSLHTVKRHIANILGKLDCVSRRQAADLYRQQNG